MIVVSDTTPFSELAKIDKMNLIRDIFGKVVIPEDVYRELTAGTHSAADAVPFASWIEVRSPANSQNVSALRSATKLGLGECAAMILAEELDANQVLIDDLDARRVAQSRNLPVIGTVGLLLIAKRRGLIDSVKEILDALIARDTRISPRLYQEVLAIAQES